MKISSQMLRWIALGTVTAILALLGAWYAVLAERGEEVAAVSEGRGFGESIPEFAGEGGSTSGNVRGAPRAPETPETPPQETESGQSFLARVWNAVRGIAQREAASIDEAAFRVGNLLVGDTAGTSIIQRDGGEAPQGVEAPEAPLPPRLWQVTDSPVAGMGFVDVSTTTPTLRFVERATGYVVDANPRTGTVTRMTTTLTPRVYEAHVAKDGTVALRTVDEGVVATIVGKTGTSTDALDMTPLPPDIASFSFLRGGANIVYIIPDADGFTGVRSDADGTNVAKLFSSAIGKWRIHETEDGRTLLALPPASNVPGRAFALSASGTLLPLSQSAAGFTFAPDPRSGAFLFGSEGGGVLRLFADVDGAFSELSLATVAEKCVWNPSREYAGYCAVPNTSPESPFLDEWYRGAVHTRDLWWRFDAKTGEVERLLGYERGTDERPDVELPVMDRSGTWIAFRDAHDQSLWILRTSEN